LNQKGEFCLELQLCLCLCNENNRGVNLNLNLNTGGGVQHEARSAKNSRQCLNLPCFSAQCVIPAAKRGQCSAPNEQFFLSPAGLQGLQGLQGLENAVLFSFVNHAAAAAGVSKQGRILIGERNRTERAVER